MKASRGMGDINPSKMPKGKQKARRDDTDFTQFAKGGKVGSAGAAIAKKSFLKPGKLKVTDMLKAGGLYENINAKRKRIASGSGEKMRKAGSKGAPSAMDFVNSAKTAKKRK
jgi:hypothetical protein